MFTIFKKIGNKIFFIKIATVPDTELAKRLYNLDNDMPAHEVLDIMYAENGANEEDPKPMLKTMLHKVVAFSSIIANVNTPEIKLKSLSINDHSEKSIIENVLNGIGKTQPQLVGFASEMFDLPVMLQRALITGAVIPEFCTRPDKPWEGPMDYFTQFGDAHVDLLSCLGKDYKSKAKFDEICRACAIPGKLGFEGPDVAEAFIRGRVNDIVAYNETDVASIYLLWLKFASMSGHIIDQKERIDQLFSWIAENRANNVAFDEFVKHYKQLNG